MTKRSYGYSPSVLTSNKDVPHKAEHLCNKLSEILLMLGYFHYPILEFIGIPNHVDTRS